MLVNKLMNGTAISITPERPAMEAWKMLKDSDVMGIPVLDAGNRVAGIITREHIISAGPELLQSSLTVGEIMEKNIAVLTGATPLVEAWMLPGQVFPVVGDEGSMVGVLDKNTVSPKLFNLANSMLRQVETILDSAHNGIIVIDKTGIITHFNSAAEKITRRSKSWALGKHLSEVIIPQDLLDVLKEGKIQKQIKFSISYSNGSHIYLTTRNPIIEDGEIVGAIAVFQDISEIEFISEELNTVKLLNKELEGLIESSYDGIAITDRTGKIIKSNQAFAKTYANTISDQGNKATFFAGMIKTVLRKGKAVTQMEKTPAGNHILLTANPVRNTQGKIFRVVINVRDLTELNQLRQELEQSKELSERYQEELSQLRQKHFTQKGLVFSSPGMQELLKTALRLSHVDSTVLLLGESGVGKEVIATTIHAQSPRKDGPFIAVNCGAIPAELLESELFGYEQGAFTGARREGKTGMFELANGGTLFLDEIGDLPKDFQVKFLRAIQEREIMKVGGSKPRQINVRIIAATNLDLESMVREGRFREDLYFRLNVVPLSIPPLRERKEDIIPLIYNFKSKFAKTYEINKDFAPEVYDILLQYQWPGNVRELENVIERLMVTTSGDIIDIRDIPPHLIRHTQDDRPEINVKGIIPLKDAVNAVEKQLIINALEQCGSTYKAAKVLQVDQSTIVRKASKLNIHNKHD
jgi:PAS domain S-box-containing protein